MPDYASPCMAGILNLFCIILQNAYSYPENTASQQIHNQADPVTLV